MRWPGGKDKDGYYKSGETERPPKSKPAWTLRSDLKEAAKTIRQGRGRQAGR